MRFFIKTLLVSFGFFLFTSCSPGKEAPPFPYNPDNIVAKMNDIQVTEKELFQAINPDMNRLRMEIYKTKLKGLNELIDRKLLENEAAKKKESVEKYLEEYYLANIQEPTEEELKKYYEFKKKQGNDKNFEDVRLAIADFLRANKKNELYKKLLKELRRLTKISIEMEPPRVDVKTGGLPRKGPDDATVKIVEFADFQCQHCREANATIEKILETYPKDVSYVFKDFPLSFHQFAQKAHEAARCAGDQDRFWEMHRILFENQNSLAESDILKYAKKIGSDMNRFGLCLKYGEHSKEVLGSVDEGKSAGVIGTPTFFVNGILISGAKSFDELKETINREIERKK